MEVEVMLECGDIVVVTIENVLELPVIGMEIKCRLCGENKKISKVGIPYRVQREFIGNEKGQKSLDGEK